MPKSGFPAITLLLGCLCGIAPFAGAMYTPSLPDISRSLAATPAEVQLTISAYLFGLGVGQLFHGPISDRFGRRPVLIVAMGVFTLTTLVCSIAGSVHILLIARALQSFSGAAGITVSRAVVRDMYEGRRAAQVLSIVTSFMALGPVIGPLVGGVFQAEWGWRSIFLGASVVSFLLLMAVVFLLGETLKQRAPEPLSIAGTLRSFAGLLRVPSYVVYVAMGAASFASGYAWLSGASFLLQDLYHFTPVGFSIFYAINSVGYLAGTATASRIVIKRGIGFTIGIGSAIQLLAGIALLSIAAFDEPFRFALLFPPTLLLFGMGLALPQSMAGALAMFPCKAGAAASLAGALQQAAGATCAALVGFFLGRSDWPVAIGAAVAGLILFGVWAASRKLRAQAGQLQV